MSPILLIGAGFSRNWGGLLASDVFDYLLGCPEISQHAQLRELLWKHQPTGGFEDALAELQAEFQRSPDSVSAALAAMQAAIGRMFADMNLGFEGLDWEFQNDIAYLVRTFLVRFDAIFSLNQDLLLEQHYLNDNVSLGSNGKWDGWQTPGIKPVPSQEFRFGEQPAARIHTPEGSVEVHRRMQPLFKLHGSSNWRAQAGGSLLVMGGNKTQTIQTHPILGSYMQYFEQYLQKPDARLMVVGYGFRDPHINDVIADAVERGLRFFVIDPLGSALAQSLNPTRRPGLITAPTALEAVFKAGLIGASRRSLRELFGSDTVEHAKVMRFFTE